MTLSATALNYSPAPEIFPLDLVALFLTVATIWSFLYSKKSFASDEDEDSQFFWIVIFVVIPFVMLIYFGSAIIIFDKLATGGSGVTALPLQLSLRKVLPATVTYIGLTAWFWLRWRKFVIRQ
jgi:hypothetical protein